MQPETLSLLKQLSLMVMGQILPKTSAFFLALRQWQRSLLATCISGILIGAILLLSSWGLFQYLVSVGVSEKVAIGILLMVLLVLAAVSTWIAKIYMGKFKQSICDLDITCSQSKHSAHSTLLEELAISFAQGLSTKPENTNSKVT